MKYQLVWGTHAQDLTMTLITLISGAIKIVFSQKLNLNITIAFHEKLSFGLESGAWLLSCFMTLLEPTSTYRSRLGAPGWSDVFGANATQRKMAQNTDKTY